MLRLRPARIEQVEELYGILEECAAFLREQGIEQWQRLYPLERFRRDVEGSLVHACERGGALIGTVTVHRTPPDYYEPGAWDLSRPAWHFCQLAIKRSERGRGLGVAVIAAIEREARSEGATELRIDIVPSNPFLSSYYEALGVARSCSWRSPSCNSL